MKSDALEWKKVSPYFVFRILLECQNIDSRKSIGVLESYDLALYLLGAVFYTKNSYYTFFGTAPSNNINHKSR